METIERVIALLAHLKTATPSKNYKSADIRQSVYDDCVFDVNPHKVPRGLGPDEAKERVELVRKALRLVYGEVSDSWTTESFFKDYLVASSVRASIADIKQSLRKTAPKEISAHDLGYLLKLVNRDAPHYDKMRSLSTEAKKGVWTERLLKYVLQHATFSTPEGSVRFQTMLHDFGIHSGFEALLVSTQEAYSKLLVYEVILERIKLHPEAAELTKVGIHELANALHHIMPSKYHNEAKPENHVLTLREAFDGKEVTDRRTWEEVSDFEFWVGSEEEAAKLADQNMDSYIDECMDLTGQAKQYFDRERFKADALEKDGRGHINGRYDGVEHKVSVTEADLTELIKSGVFSEDDITEMITGDVDNLDEFIEAIETDKSHYDFDFPINAVIYLENKI